MESSHMVHELFYTQIIGFVVALFACALFSFLETTITALRLFKLKELASTSPKYKTLFRTLEERPQQILITILIASSLANVTAAALITNIMENIFMQLQLSGGLGFSIGIGIATTAILIFGEVIPKNIAKVSGERLFRSTLWFTNIIFYALYPFVYFLMKFASITLSLVGSSAEPSDSVVTEHEIQFLIDYIDQKGLMEPEKTAMLKSIFKLGSKQVKEIMVPTIDIVMLSAKATIKESFQVFSKYQFSRLPVYDGTRDNVIGMVLQKDVFVLMSKDQEKPLKELIRPILFVPENVKINQLLREFKQKRMHIAIVLNEYGSIVGLATLEDILEEIVGEIQDEYEVTLEKIVPLKDNAWLVNGSIDLDSLEKIIKISFETEAAVTLGGFLTEQLQHLPKSGEKVVYKQYQFDVQQASPKRVLQVKISKNPEARTE